MIYSNSLYGNGHGKENSPVAITGQAYNLTSRDSRYSDYRNYFASAIILKVFFRTEQNLTLIGVKNLIEDSLKGRKSKMNYNIFGAVAIKEGAVYITIYNTKIKAGIGYDIYNFGLSELEDIIAEENEKVGEWEKKST